MKVIVTLIGLLYPFISTWAQTQRPLELNLEQIIESKSENVNLSAIADSISYIKLVMPSSVSIGEIREVLFDEELLFLSDKLSAYCFNSEGKYLFEFGSSGTGPAEHILVSSVSLNRKARQVIIICSKTQKILKFDYTGKFIEEHKTHSNDRRLGVINEQYLATLIPKPFLFRNDNFHLNVYTEDYSYISNFLDYSAYNISPYAIMGIGSHFHYSEGLLHFWDYLSNTIYQIPDEKTILSKVIYNLGRFQPPDSLVCRQTTMVDYTKAQTSLREYFSVAHAFTTKTQVYIFGHKGLRQYILYDMKSGVYYHPTVDWMIFNQGFFNDFDGGVPFWPMGAMNDSVLYMPLNTRDFEDIAAHNLYKSFKYDKVGPLTSMIDSNLSSTHWIMLVYIKD